MEKGVKTPWKQMTTLTANEGEVMRNEVVLPLPTDNASQDNINVLKARLAQYERIITNIKNELNT